MANYKRNLELIKSSGQEPQPEKAAHHREISESEDRISRPKPAQGSTNLEDRSLLIDLITDSCVLAYRGSYTSLGFLLEEVKTALEKNNP